MAKKQRTIILIDDDALILEVMKVVLSGNRYHSVAFTDPLKVLDEIEQHNPDMIISDINMPGMNGLDLVKALRKLPCCEDIPIILLSQMDSEQDMVNGYEAGATDYITKPFKVLEFVYKIEVSLERRAKMLKYQEKLERTKETVFSIMSDADRLGAIISFMEDTQKYHDFNQIAELAIDVFRKYGMRVTLSINTAFNEIYFPDDHITKPLEIELMSLLRGKTLKSVSESGVRLYEFNNRLYAGYDHCGLLIKNMDESLVKIKDFITGLCNCIDARIDHIESLMMKEHEKRTKALKVVEACAGSLAQLKSFHDEKAREIENIIQNSLAEMQVRYALLDLTDTQERSLNNMIEESFKNITEIIEKKSVIMGSEFEKVAWDLREQIGH